MRIVLSTQSQWGPDQSGPHLHSRLLLLRFQLDGISARWQQRQSGGLFVGHIAQAATKWPLGRHARWSNRAWWAHNGQWGSGPGGHIAHCGTKWSSGIDADVSMMSAQSAITCFEQMPCLVYRSRDVAIPYGLGFSVTGYHSSWSMDVGSHKI